MCTISYSIPRWRTAISCGQCRSSNMIYYAEMHRQTFEKLTWLKGTYYTENPSIRFMFVTFQYYCICWMSKTEKKTSLKLWWRINLNVLSWQDSETRPGEFVIFMLSIIIEKEDFEVNCLYKTRPWQMRFISRHKAIGEAQGLVTIQVNILSMYKHIQGRTSFFTPARFKSCLFFKFLLIYSKPCLVQLPRPYSFQKISWPPLDYLLWRRSGRFCQEFARVENNMDPKWK